MAVAAAGEVPPTRTDRLSDRQRQRGGFGRPVFVRCGCSRATLHRVRLSRVLRQAARLSTDLEAISSGDPRRIERRLANKAKGRALARLGFWGRLWR